MFESKFGKIENLLYFYHPQKIDIQSKSFLPISITSHSLLIHEADPQSRPVVIIVFAHVVRLSVLTFQNKTNFKRKQCSPLARL